MLDKNFRFLSIVTNFTSASNSSYYLSTFAPLTERMKIRQNTHRSQSNMITLRSNHICDKNREQGERESEREREVIRIVTKAENFACEMKREGFCSHIAF